MTGGDSLLLSQHFLSHPPNITLRVSSLNGSFTNFPIASPACSFGRARTVAYQRFTFG